MLYLNTFKLWNDTVIISLYYINLFSTYSCRRSLYKPTSSNYPKSYFVNYLEWGTLVYGSKTPDFRVSRKLQDRLLKFLRALIEASGVWFNFESVGVGKREKKKNWQGRYLLVKKFSSLAIQKSVMYTLKNTKTHKQTTKHTVLCCQNFTVSSRRKLPNFVVNKLTQLKRDFIWKVTKYIVYINQFFCTPRSDNTWSYLCSSKKKHTNKQQLQRQWQQQNSWKAQRITYCCCAQQRKGSGFQ